MPADVLRGGRWHWRQLYELAHSLQPECLVINNHSEQACAPPIGCGHLRLAHPRPSMRGKPASQRWPRHERVGAGISPTLPKGSPAETGALSHGQFSSASGINSSEAIGRLDPPRRTLYRLFEEATGQTPEDFIQKRRVDVTRDLLARQKNLSLHAIARLCGFRDQNGMSAVIEKAMGRKPQEWLEASSVFVW